MLESFLDLFRKVSPERMARKQLRQAQVDLLEAEAWAEHYTGVARVAAARIARLGIRMADLPQKPRRETVTGHQPDTGRVPMPPPPRPATDARAGG